MSRTNCTTRDFTGKYRYWSRMYKRVSSKFKKHYWNMKGKMKKLTCRFRTYLSRKGTPHRSHFTLFGCLFFFLGSSTTSSGSPDKPPDKFSLLHNLWKEVKPIITSGIWPRVRDRALCAPVFLRPPPRPSQLRFPPKIKNKLFPETKSFLSGPNIGRHGRISFP